MQVHFARKKKNKLNTFIGRKTNPNKLEHFEIKLYGYKLVSEISMLLNIMLFNNKFFFSK